MVEKQIHITNACTDHSTELRTPLFVMADNRFAKHANQEQKKARLNLKPHLNNCTCPMSNQWNNQLFDEFIRLRDGLRAAKRDKNYQHVLSIGQQILELDKSAKFLKIATPLFLKDMGNACIRIGDNATAMTYFKDAIVKFSELREQSGNWQNDIDVIQRKLDKLSAP